MSYDVTIVGGGIVGLATARALLLRHPKLRLAVLEKERDIALHQTGHNSGVIHRGIYYRPGSLRAKLCVEGAQRLTAYCEEQGIAWEACGKVIVATEPAELARLDELERRGLANGVPGLRRIDRAQLHAVEPHASGVAALHSPQTGIADYPAVARSLAKEIQERGGAILTGRKFLSAVADGPSLRIGTEGGELVTSHAITCAGLHADTVARAMGAEVPVSIVPFRGEYYVLRPERRSLVRGLIYPVPDPALPFLGVHFTRTVGGDVEAGPNAVWALGREAYSWCPFNPWETARTLADPGFRRLAARYWRTGLAEMRRSLSKAAFARSLQRLVPEVRPSDLVPGGAGVRAQAISRDGRLADDFVITHSPRAIHVLNAPSPAATACLSIGEYVAGLARESFDLNP